jgi:hypothetical protein
MSYDAGGATDREDEDRQQGRQRGKLLRARSLGVSSKLSIPAGSLRVKVL